MRFFLQYLLMELDLFTLLKIIQKISKFDIKDTLVLVLFFIKRAQKIKINLNQIQMFFFFYKNLLAKLMKYLIEDMSFIHNIHLKKDN